MTERSGSVPLTNGSGRPKNIRIRIPNKILKRRQFDQLDLNIYLEAVLLQEER
jgi:hypothetical protein